jgi:excisionase family DNA binding protein
MRIWSAKGSQRNHDDLAPDPGDLLLEVGSAARLLGCSASQLRILVREGRVRALRSTAGRRLFRKVDLEAALGTERASA